MVYDVEVCWMHTPRGVYDKIVGFLAQVVSVVSYVALRIMKPVVMEEEEELLGHVVALKL